MRKATFLNEICEAITEIRKIISSDVEKPPLLVERLQKEEQRLLNELYEAVINKITSSKTSKRAAKHTKFTNQNPIQGGKDETK